MSQRREPVLHGGGPTIATVEPEPMGPRAETGGGDGLLGYIRVLRQHCWLIVGVISAALIVGCLYGLYQTPMYQGIATLQVQAKHPAYVPQFKDMETAANEDTYYTTQLDIIRSRAVAASAAAQLTDAEADALTGGGLAGSPPADSASWLDSLVGTLGMGSGARGHGGAPAADAGGTESGGDSSVDPALVHTIQSHLTVFRRQDSQVIEVRFAAPSAALAAHVANLITQGYLSVQDSQRLAVSQRVSDWMSQQLNDLQSNLEHSEQALNRYKKKHGLLDSKNMEEVKGKRLSGVTQDLLDARTKRMRAQVLYNQVQDANGVDAVAAVLDNPVVQNLKLKKAKLQAELDKLTTHYGRNAPKVQQVRAELDSTTSRLHTEVNRAVASIRKKYEEATQQEQKLEQAQKSLNADVRGQGGQELELAKLEREVDTNRQLYESFRNRIKEVNLAGSMGATGVRILDEAVPPETPFKPDFKRILGLAGLLSAALAIGLAFLIENLRRTIRTPRAAEEQLRIPGLGAVPRITGDEGARLGRLAGTTPGSEFTEALGAIRTRLEIGGRGTSPRVLMVTSALPREGKTTLSSNLASSYSQIGRTLLVDADLRRPSLSSDWHRPGLTDFVNGVAPLEECVAQDSVMPNLFVMGKGQDPVDPLEFFGSADLGGAIARMRGKFDRVIVDSAPVLSVTDAEMLGFHVDGTVLAVQAGKTPMDAVGESVQRLRRAGVAVLGITLTQANLKELTRYGGYAYGSY